MSSPYFSIVIPCYNRTTELERALESCISQSFHDFELIVIDDGSDADVAGVLQRFDDGRIHYHRKTNGGANSARNLGSRLARGKYIAYLDSDDCFYPDKLRTVHAAIAAGGADIVFSRIQVCGNGITYERPIREYSPNTSLTEYLVCNAESVRTSSIVVCSELARSTGWNESVCYGDDTDFLIRASQGKAQTLMLPEVLACYVDTDAENRLSVNVSRNELVRLEQSLAPYLDDDLLAALRVYHYAMLGLTQAPLATFGDIGRVALQGKMPAQKLAYYTLRMLLPQSWFLAIKSSVLRRTA
ncbi:glycosyltransferase family A protein [Microbulbifer sp. ALW1]|uniref:glycosyltransferase family A protein n=1 Tax=Microbulbifer sp. (strain ALW1) TaxID=1516059 RepID=UPI00135CC2A5|nr:glycosyltransferase family A protein [Microbulbifer sp. ALW1]